MKPRNWSLTGKKAVKEKQEEQRKKPKRICPS